MKDAYQVLQQKEADLDRVRKQVESLHIAAALLDENEDHDEFADTDLAETDFRETDFSETDFREMDEDDRTSHSAKKPSTSAAGAFSREPDSHSQLSPFLEALKRAM